MCKRRLKRWHILSLIVIFYLLVCLSWFLCFWQVYGTHEWSFGYRERGSGVFHCSPGQNQCYTYRQSIVLGETHCSQSEVNKILRELIRAWTGDSYDPLSKNCNHFSDAFCEKLGVRKLPGKWCFWNQSILQILFIHWGWTLFMFRPDVMSVWSFPLHDEMFHLGIKRLCK